MGCTKIVLINRINGIGNFTPDVTTLLGASETQINDLYDLSDPTSSFATAVAVQDATICIDYDKPPLSDLDAITQTGYDGPFLSSDDCILSLDVGAVNKKVAGCTPGTLPPTMSGV